MGADRFIARSSHTSVNVNAAVTAVIVARNWTVLSALSPLELIGYSHSSTLLSVAALSVSRLYGVWYMVLAASYAPDLRHVPVLSLSIHAFFHVQFYFVDSFKLSPNFARQRLPCGCSVTSLPIRVHLFLLFLFMFGSVDKSPNNGLTLRTPCNNVGVSGGVAGFLWPSHTS